MADRTRPIRIEFCVTEQEKKLIESKMAQLGTHNFVRIKVENRIIYAPQATQTLWGISLLIRAIKLACAL